MHVLPVFSDRVVDDSPALKSRLGRSFLRKNNAISAFPNRNLADVTDENFPFAGARGGDGHATQVTGTAGTHQIEIATDLVAQVTVGEPDRCARAQFEIPHLPAFGNDGNFGAFDDITLDSLLLRFVDA